MMPRFVFLVFTTQLLIMQCTNCTKFLINLRCIERHQYFNDVVAFIEEKFKKYWEKIPLVYSIATVLDPCMKLGGVESLMRGITEKLAIEISIFIQDVKKRMIKIFDHYN